MEAMDEMRYERLPGGWVEPEEGQKHKGRFSLGQRYDFSLTGPGTYTIKPRNFTLQREGNWKRNQYGLKDLHYVPELPSYEPPLATFTLTGDVRPVPYTLAAADIKFDQGDSERAYQEVLRPQMYSVERNVTCTADQKREVVDAALRARAGLDQVIG